MAWAEALQALVDNLWIYMPILFGLFLVGWIFHIWEKKEYSIRPLLYFITAMVVYTLFVLALKAITLPGVP